MNLAVATARATCDLGRGGGASICGPAVLAGPGKCPADRGTVSTLASRVTRR